MMRFSIIACVGKNRELGLKGDLVFHFKEDMKFFKETTIGHPVLMGLNTFNSLPKILSGRTNYVLTSKPEDLPEGVIGVSDLETFLESHKNEHIFVIGGAYVYAETIDFADVLYLTEVDAETEADVYFPEFDKTKYDKLELGKGEENGIKFTFVKYIKK